MFKVGDKVKCIKREITVNFELEEEMIVLGVDEHSIRLDLTLIRESDGLIQFASSENFLKVED